MNTISRSLSHSLFCAYMQGGRRWPQIRGGINIFLINELLKKPNFPNEIRSFTCSEFSQEQIEKIKFVMIHDHEKAGIVLRNESTNLMMVREWEKARASVLYSLFHYIHGTEPVHEVLSNQNYDQKIYEESLLKYFESGSDTELLVKIASIAQDTIRCNHDLAQLYILANCSFKELQNQYSHHQDKYDLAMVRHGIPQALCSNPHELKSLCGKRVKSLLKENLKSIDPHHSTEWIQWGFTTERNYDSAN